ncbi:cytochrome P450 2C15 [Strongylocentrotus purpuratus]|uniref:Cytochrome P450 n=1 Tax=Strongylocentrotus purpuratus TaxID=7668 RepID=A0A7M7HIJ3_STRPU|nr:cytochrome P450 2C15 [Strongylocentrotus purpuratus]XP_011662460.2 cytochrome P450 2C15 [Strongylocentrotus purpuratus]XP_781431.4 cytochrome P450 2C15 [Strongylocentrotus purpuratus]
MIVDLVRDVFDVGFSSILLGIATTLVLVWMMKWMSTRRRLNLPPGPMAMPWPLNFVMDLLLLLQGTNPYVMLRKLTERYGEILYLVEGGRRFVFLASPELVNEVLVKQADITSGREDSWELKAVTHYHGGIVFSEGDDWKQHRRFGLAALRNFGMGKKSLENSINTEARILNEVLSGKIGKPFDPSFVINNAVSNIICAITFGRRFEYSDPKFKEMIQRINLFAAEDPGILSDLPTFISTARRRNLLEVRKFLEEEINEHKSTFEPSDVRDVIDLYLKEIYRAREAGEKNELDLTKAWPLVFDFFLAGTETTSTTLLWAFLLMAGHPEVQEKIVAEISSVIGSGATPRYEDRKLMPYTEATLVEVLRYRPIAPIGVPHRATSDLKVKGYDIVEDVIIVINILHIHHDPKIWGDPEVFRPERFLTEDGTALIKHEAYMPFGVGRRVCLGEQLAKMELFLFFTNILQKFKITMPPGVQPNYDFGHRALTTLVPKAYEIILEER